MRLWCLRTAGTEHKPLAVWRKKRTAVVAKSAGHLFLVAAVDVHCPEFQVAGTDRGKDDLLAIGRNGWLGIVTGRVGQLLEDFPVKIGDENVKLLMYSPNVFAINNPWRFQTRVCRMMGTGINDLLVAGHKIGASRFAFAGADHFGLGIPVAFDGHVENLVALGAPFFIGHLHGQVLIVGAEIGLGIIATERELLDIFEMFFLFVMGRLNAWVAAVVTVAFAAFMGVVAFCAFLFVAVTVMSIVIMARIAGEKKGC